MHSNLLTTNIDMKKKLKQPTVPQHGYRFTITSNQDGSTVATGFMTSSKPLNKTELNDLFHNWTHGKYLKSENYVSIQFQKQIKDEHRTTLSK